MSLFNNIREKSRAVSFFVKIQNTVIYPIIFAIICVISCSNNKSVYIPCMIILTALAVITGLFSDDLKVFCVPAFLIYYCIGSDDKRNWLLVPSFDKSSIPVMAICLTVLAAVLFFRLFTSGAIREMFQKRGIFFNGILLMDAALLLNGAFSQNWSPYNLFFGGISALCLTLFYCLFLTVTARSNDGIAYACKTLVTVGYTVAAEVLILALRLHADGRLIITLDSGFKMINRSYLSLPWGLPTIIAAVIATAIPAALYLARARKYPVLSYFSALFFWLLTVFIDTRSAIIFGGIMLVVGSILCCTGGRNKKTVRIMVLLIIVVLLALSCWVCLSRKVTGETFIDNLLMALRLDIDAEGTSGFLDFFSGRIPIWKGGLGDFLKAPIFGSGFMSGDYGADKVYNYMYHNVIIEFLGSMGIVGIFAFLVHLKHGLEAIIRRRSTDKFLLICVPMCILGMSLVDNFFFYPNFQIIYAAFLACAEVSLEHKRMERLNNINTVKKGEKPRVVFTFIEAGKGHIVPTRTVCDAFKKKYGDRAEVIESKFFTETGNADMEMTEKLFTRAVKNQNRSPLLGVLCKIGNVIAGDSFALQVLLSLTVSGRKTAPLAIKHVEELNANLMYSAHWATPYYVNKMKSPRPYTICFCPDVYPNGAFDVDCNNFLISTDVGYKRTSRLRMYAGGNVTKIPFPSRPEIDLLRNEDKRVLRRELGLREDVFTVSLSDGGYGMARLGSTVKEIIKTAKDPITIVALCGTNEELCRELSEFAEGCKKDGVELIALNFTDKITKYIAASDLYAGKSGANSISEPASLGVPIIITKCITYIEKGIKNYYVRNLKGALYIPNAARAAKKINEFAENPALLEKYRANLQKAPRELYNAEATADLIWQRLQEITEK